MPHVVTQACCGDASCVFACPVNCIHPSPDEADFAFAEMLYIDPDSCVDCGACVGACPVGAIVPDTKLAAEDLPFVDINAAFYREPRSYPSQAPVPPTVKLDGRRGALGVAIVGSGPAALYAADELLKQSGVRVNVFEKLPTPHGLVRAGVAPDHEKTKTITDLFDQIENQDGFGYFLNVDVGTDITHDELLAHHHAVIYATGASNDRALGIPGEYLSGSSTATDFVAWYNGHPDFADRTYDFSHRRAVVIGNGNVALDVARILTSEPARLASTDIADHALEALRDSNIEEVVILGRRGVAQAAFTLPELTGLASCGGVNLVVDPGDLLVDEETLPIGLGPSGANKRIVFRFWSSPTEFVADAKATGTGQASGGGDRLAGVRVARNRMTVGAGGSVRAVPTDESEFLAAGLVLRSIGYRGVAVDGLPFDEATGVIPNENGRVVSDSDVETGSYVAGWIKRGASGFIGTNKSCSFETVSNLLIDFNRGLLRAPTRSSAELNALVAARKPASIDLDGWRHIDRAERMRGAESSRPRVKFSSIDELKRAGEIAEAAVRGRPGRRSWRR